VRWRTAYRRRQPPTRPGCSTSSTTWRPAAWPASVLAKRQHELPTRSGEGEIPARPGSRRIWWTCWWARPGPALLQHQIPGVPLVPGRRVKLPTAIEASAIGAGHTLFIDARKARSLIDRVHRELLEADLERSLSTYHHWAGVNGRGELTTMCRGFCKIRHHRRDCGPWPRAHARGYVGAEEMKTPASRLEVKMPRLVAELEGSVCGVGEPGAGHQANLRGLGYGG